MVDGGGGTSFPVIFFDGEREINIGFIQVHPVLDYKTFQFMLSQRIGISPNQISIYIVDHKNSKSSHGSDDRRKIPVTGKANFASICRMRNSSILVVLKRSRKARSRKPRPNNGDYSLGNDFSHYPQLENVVLLRRDPLAGVNMNSPMYSSSFYDQAPQMELADVNMNSPMYSSPFYDRSPQVELADVNMNSPMYSSSFYDRIPPVELANLNERLMNLMVQKENYAAAMAKPNPDHQHIFPRIEDIYSSMKDPAFICNECENSMAPFHHCPNDAVVVGFRSYLGPVGSPLYR